MKFYFGTKLTNKLTLLDKLGVTRQLISYYHFTQLAKPLVEVVTERGLDVMLDSGAFSAKTQGAEINLAEYASFINTNAEALTAVANLDVIPKEKTQAQVDTAAERGWQNWRDLRALVKVPTLHTYHYGEDKRWLKKLMGETDYLGIGGLVGISVREKVKWLNEIMAVLCDDKGQPLRRFHGFGVYDIEVLFRYPWFSVDSTSWVTRRFGFGASFIPFNDRVAKLVFFSTDSPYKRDKDKHYTTMGGSQRAEIASYLFSIGTSVRALSENFCRSCDASVYDADLRCGCGSDPNVSKAHVERDIANIKFFKALEARPIKPFMNAIDGERQEDLGL